MTRAGLRRHARLVVTAAAVLVASVITGLLVAAPSLIDEDNAEKARRVVTDAGVPARVHPGPSTWTE